MSVAALDHKATRFLARAAFAKRAIDPISFEFLLDEPERADEVLELDRWLALPAVCGYCGERCGTFDAWDGWQRCASCGGL